MAPNDASHPFDALVQKANAAFMGMDGAKAWVCQAELAYDGALGAIEISTEVGGSFPAVSEAGDYSGCEGAVIEHGCDYKYK